MKCPNCGFESSKVIDSRVSDGGLAIRRRRECEKCEFRFTTFERSQMTSLLVEKRDGEIEPYDREKLERGILISCGKRPKTIAQVREKFFELEEKWSAKKIVRSKQIGEDVLQMLREVDEIAFIRFASIYKKFTDAEMFMKEFKALFDKK
ncbi:MAG: transcriptional regulator NrdR [Candidatus Peregrinibacteria bacterium]|nr:transcriptional regulator NrdR [Candidatus Peregrinibacteria bacterium]